MNDAIQQVMIRGRVQGVGYRAWLAHQARLSKQEGMVRNRRDRTVEGQFAGPPTVVAEMVALCRHGPPSARVESVTRESADGEQLKLRHEGERFSVLPTI